MAAGLDLAAVELVNSEQLLRHPTERIKLKVHQSSVLSANVRVPTLAARGVLIGRKSAV